MDGIRREFVLAANATGKPILSVDVPSGIECDTGAKLGTAIAATATVTFGLAKRFQVLREGAHCSGVVEVAPIGLPAELLMEGTGVRFTTATWAAEHLPVRAFDSNKGRNGSILIVAGSRRMRGAAALCALAALRVGAGLVTVASVPEVCDAVAASLPEALLLPLPERGGVISPDAASLVLEHGRSADIGLFGPGMTTEDSACRFLDEIWSRWDRAAVIDADALNAVSKGVPLPPVATVMTPHPGEMGRLLGTSAAMVQADRFGALERAVKKYGGTVLLKGSGTLIGSASEPVMVNSTGNSGLATGGTGDVLGGAIAGLMGQKLQPHAAAACAAYLHGLDAELCAEVLGSIGYRASEVADRLPAACASILKQWSPSS